MECIIGDTYGDQNQVLFADTVLFPHSVKKEIEDPDDIEDETYEDVKPKHKVSSRPRRYACQICAFRFESPSKLRKHLAVHMKRDKKEAEKRGEVFNEEDSPAFECIKNASMAVVNPLDETADTNTDNDLLTSPFVAADTSAAKRTGGSSSREKKYTCPVCQHMTESPSKLKRHMAKHNRELKVTKQL
jgi:hypothetical protein